MYIMGSTMKYTITGDNLQFVNIELQPGEEFNSVAGAMAYMSGNVRMESKMEGGLMAGLKRSLSGASLFLLKYTPQGGVGTIGLAGKAPGKVLDLDLGQGSWIVQKTGYLGSETTVKLDMALQKRISYELNKERIGKTYKCLVKSYDAANLCYECINPLYAADDIDGKMVLFSKAPLDPGDLIEAKVVNALVYDLEAEVVRILRKAQ